jgi:hypothetical protein
MTMNFLQSYARIPIGGAMMLMLLATGCRKYDQDGSLLHLRTPEARLIGTWNSARVQQIGGDSDTLVTELLSGNNLRLVADFRRDQTLTIENLEANLLYEGTWEFNADKTILHLDLTYDRTLGPYYRDASGTDYASTFEQYQSLLAASNLYFFETGSLVDVTDMVLGHVEVLSKTGVLFTYLGGAPFFDYNIGDNVTAYMDSFISGFIADGLLGSEEDYEAIVALMWSEYGIELGYNTTPPALTGPSDPNLPSVLADLFGLQVTPFNGSLTATEDVLRYILDNTGLSLTEVYEGDVRQIDVYWKILELERDDLQAYQFREFNVDNVYDFSYLLRFEKED